MSGNTLAVAGRTTVAGIDKTNEVLPQRQEEEHSVVVNHHPGMVNKSDIFRYNSTGHHNNDTSTEDRKNRMRKAVSKRFSIQLSTEQHNQTDEKKFHGPYQHLKKKMDYNYHSYYRRERQWLHDSIIEDYLCHEEQAKNCIPAKPWLIYTCGVKGAGKRWLLDQLMADGRLPLLSTIIVDPDEIRRLLPEFSSYVKSNPELVHKRMNKEAGYIAELLTLAALQAGDNVVLDGDLNAVEWHTQQFRKLRESHPSLRIALFHITAPIDVIRERIEKGAKETGLQIPIEQTQRSLEEMPERIKAFKPEVDYFCTIFNAGGGDSEIQGDTWEHFTAMFSQEAELVKGGGCQKEKCIDVMESAEQPQQQQEPPLIDNGIPTPQITTRRSASAAETRSSAMSFRQRRRSTRKVFRVNASTEENHKADDMNFYGKYSHIRETLDYNYHSNYTYERQKFQDAIITEFLHGAVITDKDGQLCTTPTEPWLVFTAGAMGAGKSYAVRRLVENGLFPLIAFITVDPDQIRHHLPEYHLYVDSNPELAGELTHKEAGYISEILTLAGLQAGKNVMVDGSLRNAEWYKLYFQRLRNDFPILRIGIIHVTAPREAIFQRAAERAIYTGRVVPKDVLLEAIEQVPKSIKILSTLVDYFVELRNDPDTPDIELATEGETWENFQLKWIQACAWVPSQKKKEKLIKRSNNIPPCLA